MTEDNGAHNVGYRKPPQRTQFAKGQSGNPKGRPKGSRNLATLLIKTGRQRVRVTENGRIRTITKFEALMLQLINKAAAGDLKAINELRYWLQALPDADHAETSQFNLHQRVDAAVLANLKQRLLQPENPPQEGDQAIDADGPSSEE
jgi:hypothetical protein